MSNLVNPRDHNLLVNLNIYQIEKKIGMIDSNYQHRLEKITRENIQKDPLTLRTKYPFDSLLQVKVAAILVVACRSLAFRSAVNRALFSLGNVTDASTIK